MKRAAIALLICLTTTALAAQGTKTPTTAAAGPTNSVACLPEGQEITPLPEAKSGSDHILRATIYTAAEQVNMTSGTFGNAVTCYPQWIREYKLLTNFNVVSNPSLLADPTPGPLLRANIGDLMEVTFLNQIDVNKFPNSDSGCDKTSTYVGPSGAGLHPDTYPDCFALSTTTNIHYHGTHTNPSSTGDNVFLEIKPSPRANNSGRAPVVTPELVKGPFSDFFKQCETQLADPTVPKQWPRFWSDLPQSLRDLEQGLLTKYAPDLWTKNQQQINQGAWPEYYMANYPYCYRLPVYTSTVWPPVAKATAHATTGGSEEHDEAADPQRPLIMGQAPGTHWYHAHKHGSTTINVNNGMTGLVIIEDNSPNGYDGFIKNAYKAYPNFKQQVILINQLGNSPSLSRGGGGGGGPHFSVNGRLKPKITMTGGEVQLWRLANNSARGGVYLRTPKTGLSWKQTAQDGVQLVDANYQGNLSQEILIAAGNRADLLVKAPMLPAGTSSARYDLIVEDSVDPTDRKPIAANAKEEPLLTVVVNANGQDMPFMATAPPLPPYLADITDGEVKGTKTLAFASSAPFSNNNGTPIAGNPAEHTIDGKKFDGEVGASVRLNMVEEWKVTNATYSANQISHPFHIHINPFQITELFDPNAYLSTAAGAGSVTTTNGSATVTGTGTTFLTSAKVGDFIWITGEAFGTVLSIQSNTQLTFNNSAKGVTNASYTIAVPVYTINQSQMQPGQCYLNPAADPASWKPCTATVPAHNRVWWDVFSIPSGNTFYNATNPSSSTQIPGYFKMRSRFVDYSGYYVLHCHILAHEDRGMMTVVEVTPLQPPYSHH